MFATGSSLFLPPAESQLTLNSSLIQVCLPPRLLSDHFVCSFLTQKSDFLGSWSTLSSEKPSEVGISGWKLEKLPVQNSVWLLCLSTFETKLYVTDYSPDYFSPVFVSLISHMDSTVKTFPVHMLLWANCHTVCRFG